ncbi:MAG: MFS transporter [Alphaproteobacteria bacterium]|nr:MFS transporter [Alphaproteobacteria bacterium]MBU1512969.1 MFS transporter [Alphaproteobacteria bacterium]MBU2094857.1 MFS transporter [Alphaproteobacteria bacterium]MBU2152763.1 MFS transporter [Alphaproteobacteria bacterium]MBU2306328.1 MFS transporter [Alphaproteobacteria bacterium]
MSAETQAAPKASAGYSYFVVWFLAIVYTLNFLDRQIVSILGKQISAELHLTKTEFGLLGGTSFALLYTTCGIGVAYLADRVSRKWIIALACAIWSLFTALCGTAQNFMQILFYRMGVGFGEAGGSPPSYSLISDYFPAERRGMALAIYSLGVPVGSMLGAFLGGKLALAYGWRTAFFVVGAPGVILAILMLVLVREPKRGGLDALMDGATEHPPAPPLGVAISGFFKNRTLVMTAISSAMSAFVGYAGLVWNPQFLEGVKGMAASDVATYYALALGATGIVGTVVSGWLADKLGQKDRRWFAWIPAIAFTLSIPFWFGILWAPTWQIAMLFLLGPMLMNQAYLAPALTVAQNAVAPAQRTMTGAILLFVLNLVGLGVGPVYVGWIADKMEPAHGEQALAYGYAAVIPFVVLTVIAHIAASYSIARDKRLAVALG